MVSSVGPRGLRWQSYRRISGDRLPGNPGSRSMLCNPGTFATETRGFSDLNLQFLDTAVRPAVCLPPAERPLFTLVTVVGSLRGDWYRAGQHGIQEAGRSRLNRPAVVAKQTAPTGKPER